MPLRVRNWADPDQRLLYYLDRDLDKLVKAITSSESIGSNQTYCQKQTSRKQSLECGPKPNPGRAAPTHQTCCAKPEIIYIAQGHDWVCVNCGVCTPAGFEEVGITVQYEQRQQSACLTSVSLPYNRNKHFKKILRDVTNMHIRVPRSRIVHMHQTLQQPVTVEKVRAYLRERKLYHYYTSTNNIARVLGDRTTRIKLDTRAFDTMCREADAMSVAFDRMREEGVITRKNFVNANVLILDIATRKFNLPEIRKHLRLPRSPTLKKHAAILTQIARYRER